MEECVSGVGTLGSFLMVFNLLKAIHEGLDNRCLVSIGLEEECILKIPEGKEIKGYGISVNVRDPEKKLGYRRVFSMAGEITCSDVPEKEFIESIVDEVVKGFSKALRERFKASLANSKILQERSQIGRIVHGR